MKLSLSQKEFGLGLTRFMGGLNKALKDAAEANARADALDKANDDLQSKVYDKDGEIRNLGYQFKRDMEFRDQQIERERKMRIAANEQMEKLSVQLVEAQRLNETQNTKEYTIELLKALAARQWIQAMKMVRQLTGYGLVEAKDLVTKVVPLASSVPGTRIPLPEEALS